MRVLPQSRIPLDLWEMGVLSLPNSLKDAYQEQLHEIARLEEARQGTKDKSIHGGQTDAETLLHFTHRFGVCAARPEFLYLDPRSQFDQISNGLQTSLTDGKVAILDIPCGCGAATAALIMTVAALRESSVLPRLPLEVNVMGGDYSPRALVMFNRMMKRVNAVSRTCGIALKADSLLWDATRGDHTAQLVDRWFAQQPSAEEFLIVVANFSGAASRDAAFANLSPSLEQILGRLHDKRSTLVWIEPSSEAGWRFLSRFVSWFSNRIPWFTPARDSESSFLTAEYSMRHPVNSNVHHTGLTVQSYRRA